MKDTRICPHNLGVDCPSYDACTDKCLTCGFNPVVDKLRRGQIEPSRAAMLLFEQKQNETQPERSSRRYRIRSDKLADVKQRMLEYYNEGLHDPQIAKLSGCSVGYVRKWRTKNGLESNFYKEAGK